MGDDSYEVALEHFLWCRAQGQTNDEILAGLGIRVPLAPSDRLVIEVLTRAHRDLPRIPAAA